MVLSSSWRQRKSRHDCGLGNQSPMFRYTHHAEPRLGFHEESWNTSCWASKTSALEGKIIEDSTAFSPSCRYRFPEIGSVLPFVFLVITRPLPIRRTDSCHTSASWLWPRHHLTKSTFLILIPYTNTDTHLSSLFPLYHIIPLESGLLSCNMYQST